MAGIDVSGPKKRAFDAEINMIPMIDLLMVTISFLLITAVWSTSSRMEASANVPNNTDIIRNTEPVEKRIHVYLKGDRLHVEVKEGESRIAEEDVQRDDLARTVNAMWLKYGSHQDVRDRKNDTVVLHAEDDIPQSRIIETMDRIASIRRGKEAALRVVFSAK